MRIYYDLLANGKKNLFNRLLTYPELAEAVLQECDLSEKKEFEHNLEKFYILDALPDFWDVNRESERIKTFIKILNCPGAMEIYAGPEDMQRMCFCLMSGIIQLPRRLLGKLWLCLQKSCQNWIRM